MNENLAHFLLSLASAIVVSYIGRIALRQFLPAETASVGGFAFVFGLAVGTLPVFESQSALTRTCILVGYLVGLAIVWYQFFKREKSNGRP